MGLRTEVISVKLVEEVIVHIASRKDNHRVSENGSSMVKPWIEIYSTSIDFRPRFGIWISS